MGETILVTGAPGNVGTELVRLLTAAGRSVRVTATNVEKARRTLGDGVTYVPFDFTRPETYGPAFAGVHKLYLMRPPAITDVERFINPAIDAARDAGVAQIVFLSLMGAEQNPLVPHAKVEKHLLTAGVPYTFLRPTYFMQNLSTVYQAYIRQHGELPIPTGAGRTSWIDTRDIAAVAARVLTEPGHENKAYTLTGSEALSFGTVAEIMGEELGRRVRWANPSLLTYRRSMKREGMAPALINVTSVMYLMIRLGLSATLTADTARIVGRPPISMRQFVRDHAACWS